MGPLKPASRGGYKNVRKITDQFTKWTVVYLLCTKDQALASLQLFVTTTVIPFGSRTVTWRVDKGGEYTSKYFKAYSQETGITQQFVATNTPQKISGLKRVGQALCAMVRCVRVDSGLPPFLWGELMMVALYICNQIPQSALNMEPPYKKLYEKDADLSHLKITGVRAFVHIKTPNKLGHTSWEGMMCGFSEAKRESYRIWDPKNASRGGEQERRFHRSNTKSISLGQGLSPQQDLESPLYDFSVDTLDDNDVSHDDMLRDVQNNASALDFGVDTPTETVELLLPQQASSGVTSPGGASSAGILPGGVTSEGSLPPPAPTPSFVAPRATNGHSNRGTVGVTPAVTRSRAASLLTVPVATSYEGGRNNRATFVEIFEAGTRQCLSELNLGSSCYTENIAYQPKSASFNIAYAYVATDALGSFSGGRTRKKSRAPSRRR